MYFMPSHYRPRSCLRRLRLVNFDRAVRVAYFDRVSYTVTLDQADYIVALDHVEHTWLVMTMLNTS